MQSPVHCAAAQKNAEILKLLMQYGGKPNLPTETGETAFALVESDQSCLAVLDQDRGKIDNILSAGKKQP